MLRRLLRGETVGPILVADLMMYEVLAGLGSAQAASEIRERLETLLLVSMVDFDLVDRRWRTTTRSEDAGSRRARST